MLEQDYIMRIINAIIRAILKLFFNIDTESPITELLESEEEQERLSELLDMVDDGEINEAENCLYDLISYDNDSGLKIALLFYSHLNDKSDDFLEKNNFSREEVKMGIENVADKLGASSIVEMYSEDL